MGFFNRKSKKSPNEKKVDLILHDFAKRLNVKPNECYVIKMVDKSLEKEDDTSIYAAVICIFDDKFSYSLIGNSSSLDAYDDISFYETPSPIYHIPFDEIKNVSSLSDTYFINIEILIKNEMRLVILVDETFYNAASDKVNLIADKLKSEEVKARIEISTKNKEKINILVKDFAERLEVAPEECYLVDIEMLNMDRNSYCSVISVSDEKLSYMIFGKGYLRHGNYNNMSFCDRPSEISHINFNEIKSIKPSDYLINITYSYNFLFIFSPLRKVFHDLVINKFEQFKETIDDENIEFNLIENENISKTDNIDDVNPFEKIKKAKELLDLGAINQEEFDEIKTKYMKLI